MICIRRITVNREKGSRELVSMEKIIVTFLALEQLEYRAINNRANGMTPQF